MVNKFRIYGGTLLLGVVGLAACNTHDAPPTSGKNIEGIVTEDRYVTANVVTKDKAAFGNPTMQMGESKYSFALKTENGMYFVSVEDAVGVTKETVDLAINPGTKVMLSGSFRGKDTTYSQMESGTTMNLYPYEIKVLDSTNQKP